MDAGKETLNDFARDWFTMYARPNLAPKTLEVYADFWDRHILPRMGSVPLREISPMVVERFQADLRAAGLGHATIIKTMSLLQGVLGRAVVWERIRSNPAAVVRKPTQTRRRVVSPPAPRAVEVLRWYFLRRGQRRDAVLVSMLAYAGLRPGEVLGLHWDDVRDSSIRVERAVSLGQVKGTKTGRARSVRLLEPLATGLAAWRIACRVESRSLVFPSTVGATWTDDDWRNWRKRTFHPAAAAVGLTSSRPYDLRHTFVSLLIHEGRNIVDVARQAGHAPTVALDTYGHIWDEGGLAADPSETIWMARDAVRREGLDREVRTLAVPAGSECD